MMTEKQIQSLLKNRYNHLIALTNIYFYAMNESDLILITFDNKVMEFEIKVSRQDYKADFNKVKKHDRFHRIDNLELVPNWFYYVCPDGVINVKDIPEYAGLITIYEYGMKKYCKIIKPAPVLHNEIIDGDKWREIAIKLHNKI